MKILLMVMILIIFIYLLFIFMSYKNSYNMESSSGYECGFSIISETRMYFSYRFFLIGMLFLIFDVEIVLMLVVPYLLINMVSMMIFMLFVMILILGLMYEYFYGSLEWMN